MQAVLWATLICFLSLPEFSVKFPLAGMIYFGGTDWQNSLHGSMTAQGEGDEGCFGLSWENAEALDEEHMEARDIRGACRLSFNLFYMTWCGFSSDLWWILGER